VKRGGSHDPDNEDKQKKHKCRHKQRGNDDFAITPFSAGGQQLNNAHPMAKTLITVPRMAMVLSDSAWSLLIEISRAKPHPMMGHLKVILGSISWRFGGHGLEVFKSYAGRVPGAAPCLVDDGR
jgi:hypothetical protein